MGSSVILPAPGQPVIGPDPNFKQGAIPNLVQFRFQRVDPPSLTYIQRDDVLVLEAATQFAGEVVTVSARLLLPYAALPGQPDGGPDAEVTIGSLTGPGYIQTVQTSLVLAGTLADTFLSIPLTEGYLLSVNVSCASAVVVGGTFVRVFLNRGAFSIATPRPYSFLVSDYVQVQQPAAWPGAQFIRPSDGAGFLNQYNPGPPGAGLDFSVATNNPGRVRLAAVFATLVTSATVANRFPSFSVLNQNDALIHYQVQEPTAVPASTTITYSLAPGGTNVRGGGTPIFETLPLPAPYLARNGLTVASSTTGLQVGDVWQNIRVLTEEWMDAF